MSLELKNPGKENVLKAIAYLNTLDEVLSAEPDYIYECEETYVPNDSYYNSQGMLEHINIEDAWDKTRGSTSVKVGIFESGISSHEDIPANRIVQGNLQYSSTEIHSHGTVVTGIIGATSNNSKGIAGIAQVKLVILDNYKFAESLAYAANNNIDIINASFYYIVSDTGEPASYSSTHAAAIQNYPGLLVCAAGNSGDNIDNKPYYPASYSFDNVISVAGVDQYDNICVKDEWASNYGANNVHIAAPGDQVFTTLASGEYGYADGTSVAAPHVTGVAALLKSEYPGMDAKALKDYIESNVDVIPALNGKVKTGGRLNAYKALTNLKRFSVIYNPNGGGGGVPVMAQEIIYGCTTPLNQNTFTRGGYVFKGWNAKRTDTGKWYYTNGSKNGWYTEGSQPTGYYKYTYKDQQKVSRTTTDGKTVMMYAEWEKKVNIAFVGNDATTGTAPTITAITGNSYYLQGTAFSRTGCTLDHWYAKDSEGNHYFVSATDKDWYPPLNKPSGYTRIDYAPNQIITAEDFVGLDYDETIYMCAYWNPNSGVLGDANMSGSITVGDATFIQKYVAGVETFNNDNQYILADVNFDGSVTVADATLIQKYIGGVVDEFGI